MEFPPFTPHSRTECVAIRRALEQTGFEGTFCSILPRFKTRSAIDGSVRAKSLQFPNTIRTYRANVEEIPLGQSSSGVDRSYVTFILAKRRRGIQSSGHIIWLNWPAVFPGLKFLKSSLKPRS